jgi:hypothetical protein
MYEDWAVEAEVLPERGRVFCIASAGCTAFALAARGAEVTAVDVNPAQVAYVRERIAGAPARDGAADRLLARLRRLGPLAGWTPARLRAFCELDDTAEQSRFWRDRLDTRRFRAALAIALRPRALAVVYRAPPARAVPPGLDRALRRRLARGFARHANRANPFAHALLLGDADRPEPLPVRLVEAEAAEFLEASPRGSFDGFSLSNVLDGARAPAAPRLHAAVRHAAAPGAVVVLRSFAEPATREEDEWAARDRSLLWGSLRVERL